MRTAILSCLFCCLLTLAVPVLGSPRVPVELTQNGLIYCTHASGFSFNPQTADAGTSMNVVTEQIYNKLFEIRTNSAELTPVLAQSYSFSPDRKTITINLRRGVKFHHTPWFTPRRDFNAEDVVFSLNRVLGRDDALPELDSSSSLIQNNLQYRIFHEQAKKVHFPYFDSINLKNKIESVKAISPYQVQINLFEPDASILSHLASQYAIIFSQEYALQLNADDNLAQLDQLPVGTGPYQLSNYLRNQHVRLVRHEKYWKSLPAIKNIIIDLSTDRTGRLAKFLNNECQIAAFPEVSQLGLLKENNEKFQTKSTEGMNLTFLAFNFQKNKLQDVELRRAIGQSLNRERILQRIYYDTASLANSIIPQISWATSGKQHFIEPYQPEQARAVLEPLHLNLVMWVVNEEQVYNPAPIKMAELIKHDLAQVGVQVQVQSVTRNYLIQMLKNKTEDYDLILTGWLAGNLDPDGFMRPILSCSTKDDITNLANWCDPTFDRLMDNALSTSEQWLRTRDYELAEQLVFSKLPIIPIANVKRMLVSSTQVQGIEMSPFGSISFEKLSYRKGEKK